MSDELPRLPPRRHDSHKGDYGRALLIGGSRGMSGAIALAGMATLRSGAGLVTLAVPDACCDTVAGFEASYMTVPLADDRHGRLSHAALVKLRRLVASVTVVALGPGLGQSVDVRRVVHELYRTVTAPLIVDADGLNALARRRELLPTHAGPRIFTPHPTEFRRLIGVEQSLPREQLEQTAIEFARQNQVVVVLKGHRSLITDGRSHTHNPTGNPAMATGGSGDVLTGVITALVSQGMSPYDAAVLGCYAHGCAGDRAASGGRHAIVARDLLNELPQALDTEPF
ncbi:MAG: NAD(P)H-hydrate dehydratase [Planctomycetaceae bacterium]|nr:NAD(P)H-hydrate dehydratase [Planctomycetaceae bacterium]